ncbi:MAG: hotdog fold thioesterase [Caldilineaceae bacterium]
MSEKPKQDAPPFQFNPAITIEQLNQWSPGTLVEHLAIEFIERGDDFLRARMPVDARTVQPFGQLHGGASVSLAETMGSVASLCCLNPATQYAVGVEINANHLRAVRAGFVYGTVTPIHVGRRTHVWDIRIADDAQNPVCISRLTTMILDK